MPRVVVTGGSVLVDEPDAAMVRSGRWSVRSDGYVVGAAGFLHRLVARATKGEIVDHINGRRTDCRRANLRLVTAEQNAMNTRKKKLTRYGNPSASRFKGVSVNKNRSGVCKARPWAALIRVDGRMTRLGAFVTELEAALAYDAASRAHHGEFGRRNFE